MTYGVPYRHGVLHLVLNRNESEVRRGVRLSPTYRVFIFNQALIVATQRNEEEYGCDVLKAVYPLSPFALLSTDIQHVHLMTSQSKDGFVYSHCPRPSADDILISWLVIGLP